MKIYLDLLQHLLQNGKSRLDRTGVGTLGVFGHQIRFNLQVGFPLLTTKKVHFHSIVTELLWFLKGDTNIGYLKENGVKIWDEWADENGNLGKIYGYQWRNWQGSDGKIHDQITGLIEGLKNDPYSRRHIVSAWNVGDLDQMKLPPCHCFFQFYVEGKNLSCQLYQRSADVFLGVPFNIASYALLTHLVAQVCDLIPYEFIHTFGDLHLYQNHQEQAKIQLQRTPKKLPFLTLNPEIKDIFKFKHEDILLKDYQPEPAILAPVAV